MLHPARKAFRDDVRRIEAMAMSDKRAMQAMA